MQHLQKHSRLTDQQIFMSKGKYLFADDSFSSEFIGQSTTRVFRESLKIVVSLILHVKSLMKSCWPHGWVAEKVPETIL